MHVCIGLDFIKQILIHVEQMGVCLHFYSIAVSHVDRCFTLNTAQCISKIDNVVQSEQPENLLFPQSVSQ